MSHTPGLALVRDGAPWGQEAQIVLNNAIKRLNLAVPPGIPDALTGAAETLGPEHANHIVTFNRATAQTITIPANADVPYEIGTTIRAIRLGAGLVTFSPDAGVTLRKPTGIKPNRFMGAVVKKAADETTANYTTATAVPFTAEDRDTDGFHDNSTNNPRLTIPSALGIKAVSLAGQVITTSNTANELSLISISKNGSGGFIGNPVYRYDGPAATHQIAAATINVQTTAADYFELVYQVETDTSITLLASNTGFQIQVTEIDPVGTITYQYGEITLLKIGADEWAISGPGLG